MNTLLAQFLFVLATSGCSLWGLYTPFFPRTRAEEDGGEWWCVEGRELSVWNVGYLRSLSLCVWEAWEKAGMEDAHVGRACEISNQKDVGCDGGSILGGEMRGARQGWRVGWMNVQLDNRYFLNNDPLKHCALFTTLKGLGVHRPAISPSLYLPRETSSFVRMFLIP